MTGGKKTEYARNPKRNRKGTITVPLDIWAENDIVEQSYRQGRANSYMSGRRSYYERRGIEVFDVPKYPSNNIIPFNRGVPYSSQGGSAFGLLGQQTHPSVQQPVQNNIQEQVLKAQVPMTMLLLDQKEFPPLAEHLGSYKKVDNIRSVDMENSEGYTAVEEHLKDAKGGTPTYFQNNGGRATGYSNYPNNFSPNNNQVNGTGTPRDNFNEKHSNLNNGPLHTYANFHSNENKSAESVDPGANGDATASENASTSSAENVVDPYDVALMKKERGALYEYWMSVCDCKQKNPPDPVLSDQIHTDLFKNNGGCYSNKVENAHRPLSFAYNNILQRSMNGGGNHQSICPIYMAPKKNAGAWDNRNLPFGHPNRKEFCNENNYSSHQFPNKNYVNHGIFDQKPGKRGNVAGQRFNNIGGRVYENFSYGYMDYKNYIPLKTYRHSLSFRNNLIWYPVFFADFHLKGKAIDDIEEHFHYFHIYCKTLAELLARANSPEESKGLNSLLKEPETFNETKTVQKQEPIGSHLPRRHRDLEVDRNDYEEDIDIESIVREINSEAAESKAYFDKNDVVQSNKQILLRLAKIFSVPQENLALRPKDIDDQSNSKNCTVAEKRSAFLKDIHAYLDTIELNSAEPVPQLPEVYKIIPDAPKKLPAMNFVLYNDETLFLLFYNWPRNLIQTRAAVELNKRRWRYHLVLKLWIKLIIGENYELVGTFLKGMFKIFDYKKWRCAVRAIDLNLNSFECRNEPNSTAAGANDFGGLFSFLEGVNSDILEDLKSKVDLTPVRL